MEVDEHDENVGPVLEGSPRGDENESGHRGGPLTSSSSSSSASLSGNVVVPPKAKSKGKPVIRGPPPMLGLVDVLQAKVARLSGALNAAERKYAQLKSSGRVVEASRRVKRVQEDMAELERANAAMERMLRDRGVGAADIHAAVDRKLYGAGAELVFGASREQLRRMVAGERAKVDRLRGKLRRYTHVGGDEEGVGFRLPVGESGAPESGPSRRPWEEEDGGGRGDDDGGGGHGEEDERAAAFAASDAAAAGRDEEMEALRARAEAAEAEATEARRRVVHVEAQMKGMESVAAEMAEASHGRPAYVRGLREEVEAAEEELAGARAELAREVRRRERREGELTLASKRADEVARRAQAAVEQAESRREAAEAKREAAEARWEAAEARAREAVEAAARSAQAAEGTGAEAKTRVEALEAQVVAMQEIQGGLEVSLEQAREEAEVAIAEAESLRPDREALEAARADLEALRAKHAELVLRREARPVVPADDAQTQTGPPGTRWVESPPLSLSAPGEEAAAPQRRGEQEGSNTYKQLREMQGLRARVRTLEASVDAARAEAESAREALAHECDARRKAVVELGRAKKARTRATFEVGGLKARLREMQRSLGALQEEMVVLRREDAERVRRFESDLEVLEQRFVGGPASGSGGGGKGPDFVRVQVGYTADTIRRRELEEQTRRLEVIQGEVAYGHAMVDALSEALSARSRERAVLLEEMGEVEAFGLRVLGEARRGGGPQASNTYVTALLATNALQVSALRDEMEDDGYAELVTRAEDALAKEQARREGAAQEIQRRFKGFTTRKSVKKVRHKRFDAAVVIQRHFRGHSTRAGLKDEVMAAMEARHRAAEVLQAYAARWMKLARLRRHLERAQSLARRRGDVLRKVSLAATAAAALAKTTTTTTTTTTPAAEQAAGAAPQSEPRSMRAPPRALVRIGSSSRRPAGGGEPMVPIAE